MDKKLPLGLLAFIALSLSSPFALAKQQSPNKKEFGYPTHQGGIW